MGWDQEAWKDQLNEVSVKGSCYLKLQLAELSPEIVVFPGHVDERNAASFSASDESKLSFEAAIPNLNEGLGYRG